MPTPKTIYLASDHAGYDLKEKLKSKFSDLPIEDLGPSGTESVDYPDFAAKVAEKIKDENTYGVLICGSGQGMAIKANRYPKVRAALCWTEEVAKFSRSHNDANVLCLPARLVDHETLLKAVETFFATDFEGGRHARRVEKLGP